MSSFFSKIILRIITIINKNRLIFLLGIFSFILFFGAIFFRFLSYSLWDGDFWYHISSGRHIVTTGSLPDKDPFSYTSEYEENRNPFPEWENSVLKHYWLSQVILYLIYDYAGPKGIIFLRASLLTLTILIGFWRLRRWSVSFPIAILFAYPLFLVLTMATGERPVLFTILFTAIAVFILEDFRQKRDRWIFLLLPLMLLWSNLHGGFIIGVIIIAVFMAGEGTEIILKRAVYARHEIVLFYTAAIIALGFSYINPTGWDAFAFAISSKYKPFFEGTTEYFSPFFLYKNKIIPINYGYIFLVIMMPAILILRNKNIGLTHVILLIGTLIMSIAALRFTFYYALIASIVIGRETDILIGNLLIKRFSEKTYRKVLNGLTVVVLVPAIFFMPSLSMVKNLRFNIAHGFSVPNAAVNFIERNKLSGNMFNEYGYGGYLTWRLYPWKKNFIDTRTLSLKVKSEFVYVRDGVDFFTNELPSVSNAPFWERLFEHYKVNFIIMAMVDMFGQLPPIIVKLTASDNWVPVFCDRISIVFVRNIEQNRDVISQFKLARENVYNSIIYIVSKQALSRPNNPLVLISLGDAFYKMGRLNDAYDAYKLAMKRKSFPAIEKRMREIESEIK